MLVNKNYKDGDIVVFKQVTGEEVVAKIVSRSVEGDFIVNRPYTVVIPNNPNQGVGLIQSVICADINNNIQLKNMHILMHGPVIKDIESHYIKTTTGLQLP